MPRKSITRIFPWNTILLSDLRASIYIVIMMEKNTKALVSVHIAVILFGMAGLFGKLISQSPMIIVLGRVFFASLFLYLLLLMQRKPMTLSHSRDYLIFVLMGILLSVHWVTFFHAIQVSSVAVGLLTYATFPVFTTFLEPFFFREQLLKKNILLAFVTLGGVALVVPEYSFSNAITQGVLFGILSGVTFALLSLLNRKYAEQYSNLVIALYQDGIAALLLLPFLFILKPEFQSTDLLNLLLLGVLFTAVAHSLFIKALRNIRAQTASIIACLEPVYGIVIAAFILKEAPTIRVLGGGIVILGAAFLVTVTSNQGAGTHEQIQRSR